jgi:hypothetical protein
MWRARDRTRNRGGTKSLLSVATAQLGTAPLHYWDFTANRALFNGVDVGAVTSTPNWGFSRASTGYAQTLAGTLVSFGSGVPRRTDKGLLVEDARTNLLLQSQTLATAPWIPFQSSVTADATAAPDGTTTADKLVEDTTAASTHFHQQIVNLTASVQTFSIYAKAAERTQTSIFVPTTAFADVTFRTASFDLTGVGSVFALSGAGATASIEALANGWYRCILNVPATLAVAANIQYGMLVANNPVYTGNGTSGLFLWGAQVEAAMGASSYITTTTVTATRPGDNPTVSSPGVNYPLSMSYEFVRALDPVAQVQSFRFDDNTDAERAWFQITNTSAPRILLVAGSVVQADTTIATTLALGPVYKHAGVFATNRVQHAINGVLGTEDTLATLPLTPTFLRFGGTFLFTGQPYVYFRRAAIFNIALTDAALQRATT